MTSFAEAQGVEPYGDSKQQTVSDVRANISRLEARARAMLNGSERHMIRTGPSVFELSKATLAEVAARRPASASHQHAPVELFMANIGFDVQEQQRLLQQMQAHNPARSAFDDETYSTYGDSQQAVDAVEDLESFLATRRSEGLQRCVDEVHRHIADRTRDLAEQHIRAFWDRRSADIADAVDGNRVSYATAGLSARDTAAASSLSTRTSTATAGLHDNRGLMASKMNAFAHIVDVVASPVEWVSHFNEFVQSTAAASTDGHASSVSLEETCSLWASVENMLNPVTHSAGSSSASIDGVKKYVAASRSVLERKFAATVITSVLKTPLSKLEEVESMHASKFAEIVATYAGRGADYWAHVYFAMRSGRYDAAQHIAGDSGNKQLQAALAGIAGTPVLARNDLKSFHDLRSQLFDDAHNQENNGYRTAVLFVLLVGSISNDAEKTMQVFVGAIDRVSQSIEDMLWVRLVCVRHVDATPPALQSLIDLQTSVLADVPHLLGMPGSTVLKVASVLFHALLPSTALRLILDTPELFVDGIHLALSFHASHVLRCTPAETQLNLPSLLQTYALRVLDMDSSPAGPSRRAAPSLYSYFSKTDTVPVFVDMCRNAVVCTKLFGQLGDTSSNEGALVHNSVACSSGLLSTMELVAESNAQCGQVDLAVHVLMVLERLATGQRDLITAQETLHKAVLILNPALSHSAHTAGQSSSREQLVTYARRVRERIQQSAADFNSRDIQAFQQLTSIAEFHSYLSRSEFDLASQSIMQLRFLPTQPSEVDEFAEYFNTCVADEVATAIPPTIVAFLKMELARLQHVRQQDREAIVQMAKSIVRWVARWRYHAGRKDFVRDLQALEHQFSA